MTNFEQSNLKSFLIYHLKYSRLFSLSYHDDSENTCLSFVVQQWCISIICIVSCKAAIFRHVIFRKKYTGNDMLFYTFNRRNPWVIQSVPVISLLTRCIAVICTPLFLTLVKYSTENDRVLSYNIFIYALYFHDTGRST